MPTFPFQLLIHPTSSPAKTERLLCTSCLRTVPQRREVYEALWGRQQVIVKTFARRFGSKRHLTKEWQGLSLLQSRRLSAPKPIFRGRTDDGRWAIVIERLPSSTTVLDLLDQTRDITSRLDIVLTVCRELARQHSKGVLQRDLHLGNFLLTQTGRFSKGNYHNSLRDSNTPPFCHSRETCPERSRGSGNPLGPGALGSVPCQEPVLQTGQSELFSTGAVFAIDPWTMKFFHHEVPRKESISNLAMLLRYLPVNETVSRSKAFEEYFRSRGWPVTKADEVAFEKECAVQKSKSIENGLRKCLRTSKRHLRIEADGWLGVFGRGFCTDADCTEFTRSIDNLTRAGQNIKTGHTCTVCRTTWNNTEIVIKRYNHKGLLHSLRHTIKGSRARQAWLHAHRLAMLDIPTPKPLAYLERYKGPILWESYLVTEYVDGQKLYNFLSDSHVDAQQRNQVTGQVISLIEELDRHMISHGDLKHTNILLTDNGPAIMDLDGMKVHHCRWLYQKKRVKELTHFATGGRGAYGVIPVERLLRE